MLPLKALVTQKAAYFARLLEGTGLTSQPYLGGQGEMPLPKKLNLAVCTIEKASHIVQHLAEVGRLSELVAVAFDEFHLLGESNRGTRHAGDGPSAGRHLSPGPLRMPAHRPTCPPAAPGLQHKLGQAEDEA